MKRILMERTLLKKILFFLIISISINIALAGDNLYQYDSLQIELEINGGFELIPKKEGSTVKQVTAELLLYPQESFRQTLLEEDTQGEETLGEVSGNTVAYEWNDQQLGTKKFGYSTIIRTDNKRRQVRYKIPFPISEEKTQELKDYLVPTATIDVAHPKIVSKASELAEGENDLFKVVFKLAEWVESNINYDLNTLTEKASQKASWVLENRQGVCDEMTSLFVAMTRSLGIPARFVKGISYSASPLFNEPWQPHGWAEVYFPEVGWVSFDPTFGQYGYIDVTHLKLRDGFDPAEPDTKYQWLSDNVDLEAKQLSLKVDVQKQGKKVAEEITLEQEITGKEVDFGSYNLVNGILENKADYYAASTLQLVAPPEVEIMGRNKRTILLAPKEVKETFWKIKVTEDLDPNYWFSFPLLIYSEKNVSVENSFTVQEGKTSYSQSEIAHLIVEDEEKSYSRKVTFDCSYPHELRLNETATVSCTIKNTGNANLKKVDFCLSGICEVIDLPINQQKTSNVTLKGDKAGWKKLVVSAENALIEKKASLEYVVLDPPAVELDVEYPRVIHYGEQLHIAFTLTKKSFSIPRNVVITLNGLGFENGWEFEKLEREERFALDLNDLPLRRKNHFTLLAEWEDTQEKSFFISQEILIEGEARTLLEKLRMWFNVFLGWFS